MDTSGIKALSFEESYARLQQVIESLEEGDLGLDQSVSLYQEGMQLASHCGQQLDAAELKVTRLLSTLGDEIDEDVPEDD